MKIVQTKKYLSRGISAATWADPEGGTGGPDTPSEKSQNIWYLSNTGQDPLKNHKITKPAFNVGPSSVHQRNKWRSLAGR